MAEDPGRAAEWGAQRSVGRCPGRPSPRGEEVTLGGEGVRPNGQAIWGASKSFWISDQSLGFPIRTIWSLGSSNVPNGPFPGHLPRPLCAEGRLA